MSDEPCIKYFGMGPWPMYFGFTQSEEAFSKEMKRLKIDDVSFLNSDHSHACLHTLTFQETVTCILAMGPTKFRSKEQVAGLVAHEAAHVTQSLWRHIGEDQPGREAESYLIQMIVQCCLQEIWGSKRERREAP